MNVACQIGRLEKRDFWDWPTLAEFSASTDGCKREESGV